MQKSLAVVALGGLLTLGMGAARAQNTPAPAPNPSGAMPMPMPMGGMNRMNPDRQLAHLTQVLSLTSAQQDRIRPLLAERQQKMQALMQDQTLAPRDRRMQMRTISEGTHNGIMAVLNHEQKQKFTQMQAEMRERMQQRRGGAMMPPAPPAQPQQ